VIDDPIAETTAPPMLVRRGRFAGPLTNRTLLETAIGRLAARLTTQLARDGWAVGTISVTLTLEDGNPWTAHRTLSTPTADCTILTEAFLAVSRTASLASGVEAVTLQVRTLVPTIATQLDLFAPEAGQTTQREATLDRLRTRYAGSFVRAHLDTPTAQQLERRVRFDPWESP